MSTFDARFKVLALSPFHADEDRTPSGPPLRVERASLDAIIEAMQIQLSLPLEKSLCPDGSLSFHFNNLKSLHPDGIVKSHPFFQKLYNAKAFIETARRDGESAHRIREGLHQWPDLPPIDIQERKSAEKSSPKGGVDNILSMVALNGAEKDKVPPVQSEADQIDAIASSILETLFNDGRFQTMESAWRGLRLLLQQGVSDSSAGTVHIAGVHAETLTESLDALTPHIVNDLPNVILLDLPFENTPISIERLAVAAEWAATMMVPLIAWVPPTFFQLSSWPELDTLPFIPHHIETQTYAKFQKVVQSEGGRWLCLACNRFRIRYPYGEENRTRHVPFNESNINWIAPVWGLGALVAQSASRDGWPTRFCDIRKYQIQDLALPTTAALPPMVSEVCFEHDRLEQFIQAGFTPLASETKRDSAFFPKATMANGASLAYQILLSQVTQFILWCKDHISAEGDPGHLKEQLKAALDRFSNKSAPPGFSEGAIEVQPTDQQGCIPVTIKLTPSAATLPGQPPIELHLNW